MSRDSRAGRIYRCFAPPQQWQADGIALASEERHHLTRVLRVRKNDPVVVFDGAGREMDARLADVEKGMLQGVAAPRQHEPSPCELWLFQAVPKGSRMDWIVEKSVELGVHALFPILTRRGVVRAENEDRQHARLARWRRLAVNAARQCGAAWIPRIEAMLSGQALWSQAAAAETLLLACTDPGSLPMRVAVDRAAQDRPRSIGLMIGPEGDWTDEEVGKAREIGAVPVGFGPRILRVDTAALYGLSVLRCRFFDELYACHDND